jgi:hypothetical protein
MRSTFAFALAALIAAPAAASPPRTIAAGWWETTNQMLAPMHSTKVEQRCIRPEDVDRFMQGPGNHIYKCSYPTREVQNGRIRLKGSCKSRDGAPFPIAGTGTYTRETLHLEVEASAPLGPQRLPVRAATDARRLAPDCPIEAAPPPPAPPPPPAAAGNATGDS